MMPQAKGTGLVGYNVQVAVDAKHHLIVAHEVTNIGSDRAQLAQMAVAAREAMGKAPLASHCRSRATSAARRSRPVMRRASQRSCPSR